MRRIMIGLVTLLAGCGQAPQQETEASLDVAESAPAAPAAEPGQTDGAQPLTVTVPKIAYVYRYSFVLPADGVAKAQAAHVALCDRMGTGRCQLLQMKSSAAQDRTSTATLKLRVASAAARRFGTLAADQVGRAGGRTADQEIEAEDVSKQMVDAGARIRQRELLVQRLTEILRTRTGKVAELVEAERSVATAQEELEAARGWLAELRGRVAYSTIDIDYRALTAASELPLGGRFLEDVQVSLSVFTGGVQALVSLLILALPWALLVGLAVFAARRWRRGRSLEPPPAD